MPLILRLEVADWQLEVAGQLPVLPPFIVLQQVTSIELEGNAQLSAFTRTAGDLVPLSPGTPIEPIFFENTRYDFYLRSRSGHVKLRLPPAAILHHTMENLTHYTLDFQNNIGRAEVRIEDGEASTTVGFEVFPRKIDYQTDYVQMREEVAAITRNLIMTVQARTFGLASPFAAQYPTLPEWLSLIRYYFKKLVSTTTAIAQNPHSILAETVKHTPIDRARHVDERALERLLRRRNADRGTAVPGIGILLPKRVPEITRHVTFDTPENRYVKAILLETQRNLQRVLHTRASGDEDADLSAEQRFFITMRPEAEEMMRELRRLLRLPFLQEVTPASAERPASLVFHRHPHYAAFERIARTLNGGLSVEGGPLRIGVKDVALLYEYWCFLQLVSILDEHFDLEQQSLVRLSHLRTTVVLQKGGQAAVRFRDPVSGKRLSVVYNRHFTRLPTIAQKPDNVIQIASEERLYVFDAKYRLAFDEEYQEQFGGIGPTVDDINTMHRYRDAIVVPHPVERKRFVRGVVEGAIVLFPYPDESEYQSHRFYRSIEQVQIGALPFLPGVNHLVKAQLHALLIREGFLQPPTPTTPATREE